MQDVVPLRMTSSIAPHVASKLEFAEHFSFHRESNVHAPTLKHSLSKFQSVAASAAGFGNPPAEMERANRLMNPVF